MEYLNESFEKKLSLVQITTCTTFNDLPDVLVIDILSRLPVRTLVQSTSIKKSWYSLIKSPSFLSTHLSRNMSHPSNYYMLLFHRHSPSVTVVCEIDNVLTRKPDIISPIETKSKSQQVIGTCRGLVCLTDYDATHHGRDIYMINPFIHNYRKIGVESSCHADFIMENSDCKIQVAFGYSEVENDYKVVRILDLLIDTKPDHVWIIKAEVYAMKSGEWRSIDISIEIPPRNPPVFMHGCLYWIIFSSVIQNQPPIPYGRLLCFNLLEEVFSELILPIFSYKLCDAWAWHAQNAYVAAYTRFPAIISPSGWICVDLLTKNTGGQVQWKKIEHESAHFIPHICMGFSCGGRLIFVVKNLANWNMLAIDKSSVLEDLPLDFTDDFSGVVNVMESLVLF